MTAAPSGGLLAEHTAVPAAWSTGRVVPYPAAVLPDLVLAQADRRPDAVAVRQWDDRLTYAELVALAGRLATELRGRGVGPDTRIGVCAGRRPELVAAVLGIMLAGAAYVPLDPTQPRARLVGVLDDAGIALVVADQAGRELLADTGRPLLDLPDRASAPAADAASTVDLTSAPRLARPEDAAYVLYTSGSTGRPKGVVVSHRSLVSYAIAFGAVTGVDADTRSFGFASLGFDVSVIDLWLPLAAGGEVELVPDADRLDPARLQRFCEEHRVTWGCLPVSLLPLLDPARLPEWRLLITGAEAVGPEQVERWAGPADAPIRRFLNCYGPTEATVCVTGFETAGAWDRPVPIGLPLPNQQAYVVDDELAPVPVGAPGELLIGGTGLARGYHDRPGLTADRFVPDPYGDRPGARLYRTGDLVSWLPDGNLLFLGRVDRQVKIRGQRVEVGEVEAVLRTHPGVAHAVVDAVPGAASLDLVAYLVPLNPATAPPQPTDVEVREFCGDRLPAAMVPVRVVRLDTFPLTQSGKVDLARLRRYDTAPPAPDKPVRPPQTELQRAVAASWCRALDVPQAGLDDDFFGSGGHSLTAMRLVAEVRAELDRDLGVEDVFGARTLERFAERVGYAEPLSGAGLVTGNPPTLSAAQRRLWFVDQLAPDAAAYNIALAEQLTGPLDVPALRAALRAVAERHEVLRWRIPHVGGTPQAVVDPPAEVPLPIDDLSGLAPEDRLEAVRVRLDTEARGRFDLATGPLWRVRLLRLGAAASGGPASGGPASGGSASGGSASGGSASGGSATGGSAAGACDEHVLAVTAHHAVFDGWSADLFYRDLAAAYQAALADWPADKPLLPPVPASFADYAVWRAARDTRREAADLRWWGEHLSGVPTVLDLPRDRPRPAEQTYAGEMLHTALDESTDGAIRALARSLGSTPSTVLLAAFGQLLRRLTGRTELVVGTPAADRRHPAFTELIGFFVDIVPLRLTVDDDATFAAHVSRGRDELVDVLAHPGAPLERIVDELAPGRDPSRAPLVQVLFNVFNFAEPTLRLPGLDSRTLPAGLPGSPFDLTLYLVERDGRFALDLLYNTDLYDAARARALLDGYTHLLGQLLDGPDRPVREAAVRPATAAAADHAAGRRVLDLAGRPAAVGEYGEIAVRAGDGWAGTGTYGRLRPDGTIADGAAAGPEAPPAVVPAAPVAVGSTLPQTPTEQVIAAVWREVLGRPAVTAVDNFFELGGNSMALVSVHSRLTEQLGRELRVVDLFRYPNVRALAAFVDGTDSAAGTGAPGTAGGQAGLSRAAQRAATRRDRLRRRSAGRSGDPHRG